MDLLKLALGLLALTHDDASLSSSLQVLASRSKTEKSVTVSISNVGNSNVGIGLGMGDGSMARFGGRYYLYGNRYRCLPTPVGHIGGACNRSLGPNAGGVWNGMRFGIASSVDLVSWRWESHDAMPEMHAPSSRYPSSNYSYAMPSITHDPTSGVYALWFQVEHNSRGVATSMSPAGPFTVVHWCVPGLQLGSDFFFTRGSDGHTYMKHNGGCAPPTGPNGCAAHKTGGGICVKRLTANLTGIAESTGVVVTEGEGGGFFERDGRWYIMHGHGCCACANGDNAETWESTTGPMGKYVKVNDAVPCAGVYPNRTCSLGAQQFGVSAVQTTGGASFLYIGLRYGSSPDGLQCHVPQYWAPLRFDSSGHLRPMTFVSNFSLTLNLTSDDDNNPAVAHNGW